MRAGANPADEYRRAVGDEVWRTLFEFDLMVAVYRWDTFIIWQVTGHSPDAMRAMRNHEIPVPDDLKLLLKKLQDLHLALWLNHPPPWDYAAWWARVWEATSPIGARSPLRALSEYPDQALDIMIGHYRGMISGDFS
jgi:hypothetical protein